MHCQVLLHFGRLIDLHGPRVIKAENDWRTTASSGNAALIAIFSSFDYFMFVSTTVVV